MNIILIVTVLLLIVSLINNFFLYNNSFKASKENLYIDESYIPNNVGYATYTLFYNRYKYPNVCFNDSDNKNLPFAEIMFDKHVNEILNKHLDKLYIIKNNKNVNNIKLNEDQAKALSVISN